MSKKESITTEQLETTYVGINQIVKALSRTADEKKELKAQLETVKPEFIKGSSIAPKYQLDRVKRLLNLKIDEVQAIYDVASSRSLNSIKKEIVKLEQQKSELDKRIKELKAELLK